MLALTFAPALFCVVVNVSCSLVILLGIQCLPFIVFVQFTWIWHSDLHGLHLIGKKTLLKKRLGHSCTCTHTPNVYLLCSSATVPVTSYLRFMQNCRVVFPQNIARYNRDFQQLTADRSKGFQWTSVYMYLHLICRCGTAMFIQTVPTKSVTPP